MEEIKIPDSKMARDITALVRDTESELLFNHSSRVYLFASLTGQRKALKFDKELLYAGAMFHDMGLTRPHWTENRRFEVDSANAVRDFLRSYKVSEEEIYNVWTAVALHTTPNIPEFMDPLVALLTSGVEMDVLGLKFDDFTARQREEIARLFPRDENFKKEIIEAFYEGNKFKPQTTFGNVNADVLALKDPSFQPLNFCQIILDSKWPGGDSQSSKPSPSKHHFCC